MRSPKKTLLLLPALLCAAVLACSLFTACAARTASSALPEPDPGVFSTGGSSAPEEPASESDPAVSVVGFAWPVPDSYRLSRGYGEGLHEGLDILGDYETPIYAIQDGEVLAAGSGDEDESDNDWKWGVRVRIDHGDGLQSLYAHLSSVAVEAGDTVEKGQLIGYMGSTGRSTGVHLHLMTSQDGAPFNPYELFSGPTFSDGEEGPAASGPAANSAAS